MITIVMGLKCCSITVLKSRLLGVKMTDSFELFFSFLLFCYSICNLLVFYEVFYSIHRRLLTLERHRQQPLGCRVPEERPGGVLGLPPAYESAPNRF